MQNDHDNIRHLRLIAQTNDDQESLDLGELVNAYAHPGGLPALTDDEYVDYVTMLNDFNYACRIVWPHGVSDEMLPTPRRRQLVDELWRLGVRPHG